MEENTEHSSDEEETAGATVQRAEEESNIEIYAATATRNTTRDSDRGTTLAGGAVMEALAGKADCCEIGLQRFR